MVVNNLIESKHFYIEQLGFELIEAYPDRIRLSLAGHQVFMFQGQAIAKAYEHGIEANETLIIPVINVDEKMRELKARGVEFVHHVPNENPLGKICCF